MYHRLQRMAEAKLKKNSINSYVLMFHEVKSEEELKKAAAFSITPQNFVDLINKLKQENYQFLSIEAMMKRKEDKNICITFDDGYEDVFIKVFPVLKRENIPFCVFMTTDYINQMGYLSMQQIKELIHSDICTIGSHTVTHPVLRTCKEKKSEVVASKQILEELFKIQIKYFAYPYGTIKACSSSNIRHIKAAGYEAAFSTLQTPISIKQNQFFIPRINITNQTIDSFWERIQQNEN